MTHCRPLLPRLALVLPVLLVSACGQGSSASNAELEQRLAAVEAKADAAEKRAQAAEQLAAQHPATAVVNNAPPPEIGDDGGNGDEGPQILGKPEVDPAPIDPAPHDPSPQ